MADLGESDFEEFLAAAAARLLQVHPDLSAEDAETFAAAAVPRIAGNDEGILTLVAQDGRILEVSLEDFDPYEILEGLG
jgi:hypothetical protein